MEQKILSQMKDHENRAWDALGKGQFNVFAFHASSWGNLNNLLNERRDGPFLSLINLARTVRV
jgi:hypothetical protein